jgi:hypothetical protein
VQNKGNMGGAFKFIREVYFCPLYAFAVRWMILCIFLKKFYVDTKLYFYYFSVLSG